MMCMWKLQQMLQIFVFAKANNTFNFAELNVFIRQHPFHIIISVFKRLSPIIYELYRRVTKALHARHPRYALHAHAPRVKQRGKANQTVVF